MVSHPVRNFQRFMQTQAIFLRYGFDILIAQDQIQNVRQFIRENGPREKELTEMTQAQKIRAMLEELGTTYVKLGQIAADQYSALPKDISEELKKLQDDASPYPYEQVADIVEAELGKPPDAIYESFNNLPMAAASIAQVHRATLPDNTQVVVKVQRPGILDQIEADLEIMYATANVLENTSAWGRNRGLVEIVTEFSVSLKAELDFRNEARNADRLRENMAEVTGIHVPEIYWRQTTDRVLTMEYIDGIKITDVHALKRAGFDTHRLADQFTQAMSKQILLDGFFHGDPHPGNVIVDPSREAITFIDLGMIGYLDEESRRELGNMMIALQEPDTRELVRIALRLGIVFDEVDERALRRNLEHILNRYMVASLSEVSFADMMYEIMNALFDHGIRLPSEMTLAIKALMQTQEIASTLNPELRIDDIATTVSDQLFWEQFKPSVVQDRLNETTAEVLRLTPIAADAVERLLREAKTGKLTIKVDMSELQLQLDSLSENNKRITIGLTTAGMIIGSAIAMSVSPQEAWSFIPLLGVIGFVVSITIGAWMVLKLLWEIWGP